MCFAVPSTFICLVSDYKPALTDYVTHFRVFKQYCQFILFFYELLFIFPHLV